MDCGLSGKVFWHIYNSAVRNSWETAASITGMGLS
jgi:hypothetical protein